MSQEELIAQCNEIEEWFRKVNELFGTGFPADKQGRREVTEYISLLLSCDAFEPVWLKENNYQEAGTVYLDGVQKLQLVKDAQKYLCELLLPGTEPADTEKASEKMNCDAEQMQKQFAAFEIQYQQAMAKGLSAEELETEASRKKTKESLREESEILKYTIEFAEEGCGALNRKPLQNDSDLQCLEELVRLLCSNIQIPKNWITESRYSALIRFCRHQKQLFENAQQIQEELAEEWTDDIYKLDLPALSDRFNRDYNSMLKRLGRQYRIDHDLLESLRIHAGENVLDSEIREMLEELQKYQVCSSEFRRNDAEAKKLFGPFYNGWKTDWNLLEDMLNAGKGFNDFYLNYGMPEEMLKLCCGSPEERRKFPIRGMTAEYMEANQIIPSLRKVTALYRGRNYIRCYKAVRTQWKAFDSFLSALEELEGHMIGSICEITEISCRFEEKPTIELLKEYIRRYTAACNTVRDYLEFEPRLRKCFPVLYTGMNSQWERMYYSWKHGKRICEYAEEKKLPEQSLELLNLPLEERQNCRIGERSLMDLAFGNGRRDYVEFFNQHPQKVTDTREQAMI